MVLFGRKPFEAVCAHPPAPIRRAVGTAGFKDRAVAVPCPAASLARLSVRGKVF